MIAVRHWGAIDSENGVANKLIDGPTVLDDDVGHACQEVVENLHHPRRITLLSEACVATEVGHQDRNLALLPPEPEPFRRLQQSLRNFRRYITPEGRADEVALAQALDHLVEGARQSAHLVAGADRQPQGKITAGDARHAAGER